MGAFNWVIVQAKCPACGETTSVRCQTHVASDYDGDQRGRFHDQEYRLGERMRWWNEEDPRYAQWRIDGTMAALRAPDYDEEACYSTCSSCSGNLCAVIRFSGPVPERLVKLVREEDWPSDYRR